MGIDASDYDLAWAYYYRGCSYRSKGEFDLASRDFEAAISVDSSGFPKDLAYIDLPLVQHDKPETPRVVHYVKPCKAVREAGELNFLCSKYYLGVNCDACLQAKHLEAVSATDFPFSGSSYHFSYHFRSSPY